MKLEKAKNILRDFDIISVNNNIVTCKCNACSKVSDKNINKLVNKCRVCSNRKTGLKAKRKRNKKLKENYPCIKSIIETGKQYPTIEFTCKSCLEVAKKNMWAFKKSQVCTYCNCSKAADVRLNSTISHVERISQQIKNISSNFYIGHFTSVYSKVSIECNVCAVITNDKIYRVLGFARANKPYKCRKCTHNDKIKLSSYNLVKFYENSELGNNFGYLYMYEITFNNSKFFKIGITRNTVFERIGKIKKIFDISNIVFIKDTNLNVAKMERKLKSKYKNFKIIPDVKFEGYTECFTIPVLFEENMKVQRLES